MADTSELDALIVRSIGDVEAAVLHARAMGDTLFEDIGDAVRSTLGEAWDVAVDVDDDNPVRFTRRAWIEGDPPSISQSYHFSLSEKPGPAGETGETWLSTLLATGPAGASAVLHFWSDTFNAKRRWRRLADDQSKLIDLMLDAGFRQDSDQWLYVPLIMDAETLARGYEEADLSEALASLRAALAVIQSVMPSIEALIERDRTFD